MRNLIFVGLGGMIGSVLRYMISGWGQSLSGDSLFPVGTLLVNVIGCLAIGFTGGWSENIEAFGPDVRVFLMIGMFGGFTTFSSFGYETLSFARDGQFFQSVSNITLQLVLGLGAVWLGYSLSHLWR